ncbi:MAG: T9SS type A sorting domain-containing protein [bacterium]
MIVTDDGCAAFDTAIVDFIPCLGIDDLSPGTCLTLFPNPFPWSLTILNSCSPEAVTATLYNIAGQQQLTFQLKPGRNDISTSSLPPGIYLLHFQIPGFSKVVKWVKGG